MLVIKGGTRTKRVIEKVTIIKQYYYGMSAPIKASMWFLVCSVIQKCFTMISTPIFTRLLSTTQYGQVAIYYSWYDLLYPFVTMYLSGVAYNNVLIQYENERDKATLSLMTLASLITAISFSIYFVFRKPLNSIFEISTLMMCVMFLEFLFVPILDFWSAKERYDYKYKKLIIVTLGSTVASLVLGITFVLLTSYRYEARIVTKVMVSAVVGVTLYYFSYKRARAELSIKYWKYALKISIPLIPHYLSMKMLNQADRVMITKMVNASTTGIYSLAYTLASLVLIVTDAINRSMCPFVYKGIKENNITPIRKMTNSVVIIVLLATILEMFIAPELIGIFATQEYREAVWIIPPVALSMYFMFLYVIFSNVEFYYEKTIFATVVSLIVSVCNIGLNYLFINLFGYLAAGYTTLACYILLAILHYCNFKKVRKEHESISDIYDIKFILLISFIGLIVMFVCVVLYNFTIIRWGVVGIICFITILKRRLLIAILRMGK